MVIDVGMNRDSEGKLCGDVDFAGVEPGFRPSHRCRGGVGPHDHHRAFAEYRHSGENFEPKKPETPLDITFYR